MDCPLILWPLWQTVIRGFMYSKHTGHSSFFRTKRWRSITSIGDISTLDSSWDIAKCTSFQVFINFVDKLRVYSFLFAPCSRRAVLDLRWELRPHRQGDWFWVTWTESATMKMEAVLSPKTAEHSYVAQSKNIKEDHQLCKEICTFFNIIIGNYGIYCISRDCRQHEKYYCTEKCYFPGNYRLHSGSG